MSQTQYRVNHQRKTADIWTTIDGVWRTDEVSVRRQFDDLVAEARFGNVRDIRLVRLSEETIEHHP